MTGFNDNSELCNSIQSVGEGVFPKSWNNYLKVRDSFDNMYFDQLAFEKQRTMLFSVSAGTEITITKVVHHGWGTDGRYWAIRGDLLIDGQTTEVELPSFSKVHLSPFWLNGKAEGIPQLSSKFLARCQS